MTEIKSQKESAVDNEKQCRCGCDCGSGQDAKNVYTGNMNSGKVNRQG